MCIYEKKYFDNTSYASKKTLCSFYRKKDRLNKNKENIVKYSKKLLLYRTKNNYKFNSKLSDFIYKNFFDFCEGIYSCLEYIGYIMYIYQKRTGMDRGQDPNTHASFHDILNYYNDEEKRGNYKIFKSKELCEIMKDISEWYYILRDIRSKEVHYNSGIIITEDNSIMYANEVDYGNLKRNKLDITNVDGYYIKFDIDTEKIIQMLNNYKLK